jgi:hypothetical protein
MPTADSVKPGANAISTIGLVNWYGCTAAGVLCELLVAHVSGLQIVYRGEQRNLECGSQKAAEQRKVLGASA